MTKQKAQVRKTPDAKKERPRNIEITPPDYAWVVAEAARQSEAQGAHVAYKSVIRQAVRSHPNWPDGHPVTTPQDS